MSDSINESTSKTTNNEPVSRFWSCFFSTSIFGLLWTQKMNKTTKWIPVFIMFVFVWFVMDNILNPIQLEADSMTEVIDYVLYYPESNRQLLEPFVDGAVTDVVNSKLIPIYYSKELVSILSYVLVIFYDLVAYLGSLLLMVYLMFKWTTQYNIKNFGYKSKKEWKKTINNKYNYRQNMKNELKTIGKEIKDNILKTKSKIKLSIKTSDDEVIEQINKWYKLMKDGIISESEFEDKKSKLLNKSQN